MPSCDPVSSIANALDREPGGIAIIYYPDLGLREWLISEVASIAGRSDGNLRVSSVGDAIRERNRLVLLVPADEKAAVETLDGSRDQILEPPRQAPIVLFLLRDGDGQRALATAPALASIVRGSDPDPEQLAAVDSAAERQAFRERTGKSPAEWLAEHAGEAGLEDSHMARLTYWALLLESR